MGYEVLRSRINSTYANSISIRYNINLLTLWSKEKQDGPHTSAEAFCEKKPAGKSECRCKLNLPGSLSAVLTLPIEGGGRGWVTFFLLRRRITVQDNFTFN